MEFYLRMLFNITYLCLIGKLTISVCEIVKNGIVKLSSYLTYFILSEMIKKSSVGNSMSVFDCCVKICL